MSLENLHAAELRRRAPAHATALSAAQATTNDFAIIPESVLSCTGHNSVGYYLTNADASNVAAAKIVGRYRDSAGAMGAWIDAAGASAAGDVPASGGVALEPSALPFDEVALMVESKVDDSHASIDSIFGTSKWVG
jgi:hypothetical protein